jgi:hypothetical protein
MNLMCFTSILGLVLRGYKEVRFRNVIRRGNLKKELFELMMTF